VNRLLRAIVLGVGVLAGGMSAHAVTPGEMLADPALEARAREISAGLRCLVCQNQSIDDSNADLARDLRVLVRERLSQGDSNEAVLDYVVSRYGEFVLLSPRVSTRTVLLWGAPLAILALGAAAIALSARTRAANRETARLSPEEEAEIARLTARDDDRG
jgi:cytochrome c-type biogenesis protein CcmH